jgi:tetratricopeptide (TPR) repeat protein
MPNRSTDALFQLVKSLEKSEKRNFKLYVQRNSSSEDLKIVQLFDALDKMDSYDENLLLSRNKTLKKQQLSNIKAHLYRQILSSLRLIKNENNIDIQLHEMMDHARILYNKGLYLQSLKMLDRMKEMARSNNQVTYLLQVLFFEKKIEALHITRSMTDRAEQLTAEVDETNRRLFMVSKLSNLSLLLYSWYIKNGHARDEKDEKEVQQFFDLHFPPGADEAKGFYERLYLYQSYCWYAFIRQDFLMYYRYTQKWVELFDKEKFMIEVETAHYIKGMHNLMGAHFDLQNHQKLKDTLDKFEAFAQSDLVQHNHNNKIQTFVYLYVSKINKHFMEGTFSEGLKLVPEIEGMLKEYEIYLDRHRILVFYYKLASLYFGSGHYEKAIDYLNKIINWKVDLRTDLQCYSRLLHLIAHYELGNFQLLEYLFKSVYRFMAKLGNLSVVEEEIFRFLRRSFHVTPRELKPEFAQLLEQLKQLEGNRFETRAFSYLDIISWLESKIHNIPATEIVIRQKFVSRMKRKAVEE